MALAVVNAIPDYHQDRLVGKRNLVVRLGRKRGVRLYVALAAAGLSVAAIGVAAGVFPVACLAALLAAPLLVQERPSRRAHVRVAAPVRARDPRRGDLLSGGRGPLQYRLLWHIA
jgi:1,4-dihydroxy-2-naphthoate octaprenyltransferase